MYLYSKQDSRKNIKKIFKTKFAKSSLINLVLLKSEKPHYMEGLFEFQRKC